MSASTAVGAAEQWIYQTLAADAALAVLVGGRIYSVLAPQTTAYPMVVFACLTGVDTNALAAQRVLTQLRYAVHCADKAGSIAGLDAIARRVDQLLQAQIATTGGGAYELGCQRHTAAVATRRRRVLG